MDAIDQHSPQGPTLSTTTNTLHKKHKEGICPIFLLAAKANVLDEIYELRTSGVCSIDTTYSERMSLSNVLTTLLVDPAFFREVADRILTHDNSRRLKGWAQAVTNTPHIDPAQLLIRTLIFADAPAILAELSNPESSLISALFPGYGVGGDSGGL